MPQSVNIQVKGKVQGVFFRKYTQEKARSLGLTGFVKNMPDASVQIIASGEREALQELETWCNRGSPGSVVASVTVTAVPYMHFETFRIER